MAFDWIKVEKKLANGDPRILELARELRDLDAAGKLDRTLSLYRTLALGSVIKLWITCAAHTDKRDLTALVVEDVEDLIGIKGLCELLPAEWAEILDGGHLKLPGFHAHNGTEALAAASNAERQERYRTRKRNGPPSRGRHRT